MNNEVDLFGWCFSDGSLLLGAFILGGVAAVAIMDGCSVCAVYL